MRVNVTSYATEGVAEAVVETDDAGLALLRTVAGQLNASDDVHAPMMAVTRLPERAPTSRPERAHEDED